MGARAWWRVLHGAQPATSNRVAAAFDQDCGGQWGESTDEGVLERVAWPRGAAALEKLWSPRHFTTITNGMGDGGPCAGALTKRRLGA